MEEPIAVNPWIKWIGVNDFHTDLFEAIWPLPHGVSYNSYVILDDQIAIIDTVKAGFLDAYLDKLQRALPPGRTPAYLIVNHMEPDHSGAIRILRRLYPEMKIVGNKKTIEFLKNFYEVTEGMHPVGDGDQLALGHTTLHFHLTPMVHWPETMMSYESTTQTLFSGDAFGGFGALCGGIFDDEVDLEVFEYETLRYYSNIVGKYSPMVQKAIAKVGGNQIKTIAATHGPVYRTQPGHILDRYDRWSRYEAEKGVVIAYASMYGNTERLAEAIARSLAEQGIEKVLLHNVSRTHLSYLITDSWRYQALILGSCTYNQRLFPLMEQFVNSLDGKMMQHRITGIFGSYTWSGGALKALQRQAETDHWQLTPPQIETQSGPTAADLEQCAALGRAVAARLNGD